MYIYSRAYVPHYVDISAENRMNTPLWLMYWMGEGYGEREEYGEGDGYGE